jgi:hypothetical protein
VAQQVEYAPQWLHYVPKSRKRLSDWLAHAMHVAPEGASMTSADVLTKLRKGIDLAQRSYDRLVLLVWSIGSGKTRLLHQLAEQHDCRVLNVNLELSRRMLELPKSGRARQVDRIFKAVFADTDSTPLVLDNLEMLFDPALKVDPLRLLQSVSRNQTVVASWSGTFQNGTLTYAEPDHPEYRSYQDVDAVIVMVEQEPPGNF